MSKLGDRNILGIPSSLSQAALSTIREIADIHEESTGYRIVLRRQTR